jgi:ELWxxDGT repeat protein
MKTMRTAAAVLLLLIVSLLGAGPVGAATGPYLVKDLRADGPSNPQSLTEMGSKLYFSADDGIKGRELYVSDGTFDGTKRLKDIWVGKGSSNPNSLTAIGDQLFFVARDGVNGSGMYVTDGTNAGTKRLGGRRSCGTEAGDLLVHGELLYYAAYDSVALQCNMFRSDGTVAGTYVAVPDIEFFLEPTSFKGRIYFAGGYSPTNGELWKSDGTPAGTKRIKTISPGHINQMTVAGDLLYFVAADSTADARLWRTDGTRAGTKALKTAELAPRSPGSLTAFNDRLYFSAFRIENNLPVDDGLWRSNGTGAGTKLIKEVAGGSGCVDPQHLTPAGSLLFFVTCDLATSSYVLWKSAGSAAGTEIVADLANAVYDSAAIGDLVFMTNWDLIQSDGTAAGTRTLAGGNNVANLEVVGQALFFTDGPDGELYRYVP